MRQYTNANNLIKYGVVLFDFIAMNALLIGFVKLGTEDLVPHYFLIAKRTTAIAANIAMIISQYFFHSVICERNIRPVKVFTRVYWLTFFQVILMFAILRFLGDGGGFLRFFAYFWVSEYILLMVLRGIETWVVRCLRGMGSNSRRVLFVGSDPALAGLYKRLIHTPSLGYNVIGYYSNSKMANEPKGLKRLGTIDQLNAKMEKEDEDLLDVDQIDELFCSMSHDYSEEILNIMKFCDKNIIRFFYVPRMFGNIELNLKPELFGDISVFTNHVEPLSKLSNRFVKRTFDIVFSSVVCLCLLPFIPIIALIIKIQSPGPLFFKQKRTGINGKTFDCIKFRSMHVNKQADQMQATENDPRKFAFGDFMRKTNIDELPQFFNVLKGDMSVVGPRPHMLYHTQMYGQLIDKYMVRHFCKPGITGWAQVTGFRGETKELWQMEERIKRDVWYIENWSFWLDIRIIFMTLKSFVVHDKHAY